jgi:hypothetical protein
MATLWWGKKKGENRVHLNCHIGGHAELYEHFVNPFNGQNVFMHSWTYRYYDK